MAGTVHAETLPRRGWSGTLRRVLRHRGIVVGGTLLAAIVLGSILAPLLAVDPQELNPIARLMPPGEEGFFGTDHLGRDILARTLYGGRVSLFVGISVALLATFFGTAIGLVAGFVRAADGPLMRIMDGVMAIPAILLAIAMVAVTRPSVANVIFAVTVVETPRVARLVRSVVLTIREQPYIEAAIASGTRVPRILVRHVLPNTAAPLIVQATYVAAAAILIESLLSFLGTGTPASIPTWGNIVAEGRTYFQLATWIVFFPGLFLAITVLAINLLGDGLRDLLDPRHVER
ncbi:MAG: ABC transporter permease [Acetobacteraceae bacterium]|jgi:peptide/nickel transport system permease protein|nr:ABC transporter permease [Acetobacteraceae bacterium]